MPEGPKLWNQYPSFKEAEKAWDAGSKKLEQTHPLKTLKTLPKIPHITPQTSRFLRFKALKYLLKEDQNNFFFRLFSKRPFHYGKNLLFSYLKRRPFIQKNDLFYYGLKQKEDFENLLKNPKTHLVVGFSYCQKPFECPSNRFSSECIHNPNHPVCRQCLIGKYVNTIEEKHTEFIFIPTVHYVGEKLYEIMQKHPKKQVIFLITSCELCLKMFADWGNMLNIKGMGVRLQGRICNTMKAFKLSEKGIKPGLTLLTDSTQDDFLKFLKVRYDHLQKFSL